MSPKHYLVRRRYSSISPPPIRGYVLCALATDDPDEPKGVLIDRFPVLGVATCTESIWTKSDPALERSVKEVLPLSTQEIEQRGYRPESEHSDIVPVILYSPNTGEPNDEDAAEECCLTLLKECDLADDPHIVVWCSWEPSSDEHRMEPIIRRLKGEFIRKRRLDK